MSAKSCGCGQTYDEPAWKALRLVGVMKGDGGPDLELRDCRACGSTIARELPAMKTNHIYVISAPGHDLDGEEHIFYGTEAQALTHEATLRVAYPHRSYRKIGTRHFGLFRPCAPASEMPWWAVQSKEAV